MTEYLQSHKWWNTSKLTLSYVFCNNNNKTPAELIPKTRVKSSDQTDWNPCFFYAWSIQLNCRMPFKNYSGSSRMRINALKETVYRHIDLWRSILYSISIQCTMSNIAYAKSTSKLNNVALMKCTLLLFIILTDNSVEFMYPHIYNKLFAIGVFHNILKF